MPNSEIFIGALLLLNALVTIALAVLIFIRAHRQSYARFFIGVLLCAAGWTLGDLLILYATTSAIQGAARYAFYIAPMGVPPLLWFFSLTFPEGKHLSRRTFFFALGFSVVCITLASRFIDEVGRLHVAAVMNNLVPAQPGFLLYGLYLSVFFTMTYVVLFKKITSMKGVSRTQAKYTFYGVLIGSCLPLVSNVSLPAAGITQFIWLGPTFTLAGLIIISLAIIRYHLFDIRFFVLRAIAYLVTLFLVTVLFVTPFVLLAQAVIGIPFNSAQTMLVIAFGVLMLYSFLSLKAFFDGATSALFLRNYYDSSYVLDTLSKIIVHTGNLEQLKVRTADVLDKALKPQFIKYVFLDERSGPNAKLGKSLAAFGNTVGFGVIDIDLISPDIDPKLVSLMRESQVAVAAKLHTTHADLGYIVLSHKRSGGLYSDRDKQLLGVAADEIAISLQNMLRYEEIRRFSETLQGEVDNATRKLRRSNERLRELDDIKDDFISMASHQLRTPLTAVKGYLSMVLDGDAGKLNETQMQMLRQAFASSQRMVFLITDLLNVSRLKTGKFVVNRTATDLSEMIKEEIIELQENADAKRIKFSYKPPKVSPKLMLDEIKIRQVIMNFIDNAIYYTKDGGHITVELTDKPAAIELHVIDDGIGVPKSEQHHLFTKFYRATNARKARPDGTGLGLFMAQKVIVAHGGSVIFHSEENQGSTFGFALPKE